MYNINTILERIFEMGKKTSQKFITLTSVIMAVIMVAYVALMFVSVNEHNYEATQASSEFINAINNGNVKLNNENYAIEDVECVINGKEIDLKALKGSDNEIKQSIIKDLDYKLISTDTDKRGSVTYNITAESDPSFDLKWTAYNSPAKLIWFPQHPTAKDFISEMKSDYYREADVEYDINDVVLFPVIMFVLGIVAAVLIVVFSKYGFFLVFPFAWIVSGFITHISGFVSSTVPQMFIYNIFKDMNSTVFTVQFVLVILTLVAFAASVFFRSMHHKAVKAEEAAYYMQNA